MYTKGLNSGYKMSLFYSYVISNLHRCLMMGIATGTYEYARSTLLPGQRSMIFLKEEKGDENT